MKKITKYALAAALVLPSVFAFGANKADAAKAVINKDLAQAVNVRENPEMGNNVVGLIDNANKDYEILRNEGDWLKISFDGQEAYVGSYRFHILEDTKVISPSNFREEPSLDSKVIKVLDEGTKVEVLGLSDNGFVKVSVDNKEGYIYHNLLESFKNAYEKQSNSINTETRAVINNQSYSQAPEEYYEAEDNYSYAAPAEESYQGSSNWAKEWIAQRESGGSYTAYNAAGGYYGRYQLNPSLVGYGASPAEQEAAADNYVYQRYGSWEAAQSFWAANGRY